MMQVQVEIVLGSEQHYVNIHQLAREDATPDERAYAQSVEEVLVATMKYAFDQAGEPLDVEYIVEPEVERLRAVLRQIAAMDDAEGDSYERLCDAAHMAREALGDG